MDGYILRFMKDRDGCLPKPLFFVELSTRHRVGDISLVVVVGIIPSIIAQKAKIECRIVTRKEFKTDDVDIAALRTEKL